VTFPTLSAVRSERRSVSYAGLSADPPDVQPSVPPTNAHYAAAEQLARVGSWRWDVAGNVYHCSDEMYRVFGFQPGDVEPTLEAFLDVVHPDDRARMLDEMDAIRTREGRLTVEYRIILATTGEERWIEASAEAILGPDGTLTQVLGVAQDVTARRVREIARTQRENAEAYCLLRTLEDNAPVGLGFIDRDFRYVHVNEQLATVNGVPVGDHAGRKVAEVVPHLWAQIEPLFRRVLDAGERVVDQEITGVIATELGRLRSWLASYYPVRMGTEIIGIGVVVVEVTERQEAEQAHRRWEAISTSAAFGMAVIDNDSGRIEELNPAFATLHGYPPSDLVGHPAEALIAPEDLGALRQRLQALRTSGHEVFELTRLRRDGSRFASMIDMTLLSSNEDGGSRLCYVQDVEDLKQAQEGLHESEAQFRGLFAHAPMAMYVYDRSTLRFLEMNEASLERYGYTREEFLAMGLLDIRPPEEIPLVKEIVAESHPTLHHVGRFHHLAKDGTRFSVEVHIRDIRFGGAEATLVIAVDVSDREKTEVALRTAIERERDASERERELNQLKTQLLTSVSHELRTPLTNIVGMTRTLNTFGDAIAGPDRADLIERLEENASHLDRLIADLIDLDRLTRGTFEPRCAEGVLPVLTHRLLDRIDLGERKLSVSVDPVTVSVDHSFFDHILEELLANLARHTKAGTPAALEVHASSRFVEISVTDWGPGVPDQSKESIFEPFRHGEAISHSPGQGIGLALVRQLAAAHGGRAWVTDNNGGGASFRVTLRQRRPPAEETESIADASTVGR